MAGSIRSKNTELNRTGAPFDLSSVGSITRNWSPTDSEYPADFIATLGSLDTIMGEVDRDGSLAPSLSGCYRDLSVRDPAVTWRHTIVTQKR